MEYGEKDIEKLIGRRLDDQLSEDEQLQLDRELIRSPESRRLMERSEQTDHMASSALREALDGGPVAIDLEGLPAQQGPSPARTGTWMWRLIPGAMAAAMLALVFSRFPLAPAPSERPRANGHQPIHSVVPDSPYRFGVGNDVPMRRVSTRPSVKRASGRDVLGVIGEDGNIYWIEVDRSRTIRRPNAGPKVEF